MNITLTQAQLAQIVSDAVATALSAQTETTAPATTKSSPAKKADPRYRTAAQKTKGAQMAAQIWAAHYAAAGVKSFKALTPAQQKAAKAEVAASWKSIKGTRKTAAK